MEKLFAGERCAHKVPLHFFGNWFTYIPYYDIHSFMEKIAWVPTPDQKRAAHALADPRATNYIQICAKAGVSRARIKKFMKDPDFCAYVHDLLPQFTDTLLFEAWKLIYKKIVVDEDLEAVKVLLRVKKQLGERISVQFNQQNIFQYEQMLEQAPTATRRELATNTFLLKEGRDYGEEEEETEAEEY